MFGTLIDFLTSNKDVIGTIIGIVEGIVVLVNMCRKFRSKKVNSMSSFSVVKSFLWICNPFNCFRKL